MDKGYYRVHLVAEDGDWITLHVPLNEQGLYDKQGRTPHPLKAKWAGEDDYGEFIMRSGGSLNRIVWGYGSPDYLTDLLRAPLHQGAIVQIYEGDDANEYASYTFTVKHIDRL